jgi:rfaE bifunctional protein nucleotidyltransferase chain/domain
MTESKILSKEALLEQVKAWKKEARSIVLTNGCFDILHLGHVDYLEKAAHQGDKLIVALNTDASVQRLKGPSRPIIPEQARARLMAALAFVDAVVLFDEATPLALIQEVEPNVLIKGDDYQISNIVGANDVIASGGKVVTIPLVKGFSTSGIIKKIKNT